jgi:hypothetical protein
LRRTFPSVKIDVCLEFFLIYLITQSLKKRYRLQIIDTLLMPLGNPIVHTVVHVDDGGPKTSDDAEIVEDDGFQRAGHWMGANEEWIAFAQRVGLLVSPKCIHNSVS